MADFAPSINVSLFYRPSGYTIGTVGFDLLLNEAHNFDSTITEHPIEDGSKISDHIDNDLENGSFTGMVSNFSINSGEVITNRAQDAFDALKNLWKSRILVTLVTTLQVYEDIAIESMSSSRDGSTGEMQTFDISFKKVKIVRLKEVALLARVNVKDMTKIRNRQAAAILKKGRTRGR